MADPIHTQLYATHLLSRIPLLNSLDSAESVTRLESLDVQQTGSLLDQKLARYRHGHFVFLKLPLELREAIYKILFGDNKHYPPSKQPVRGSQIFRPGHGFREYDATRERLLPTAILRACQQIYHEARNVLYRMRPAKISVHTLKKDQYLINSFDTAPLLNAQTLMFVIGGRIDVGPVQYAQKRRGSIGDMLAKLADILVASQVAAGPCRQIRLKFTLTGADGYKPKAGAEDGHSGWFSQIWNWAQTGEAVKAMKEDIKKRAPAMNNLKVTSNVEGKIPRVKTVRYDASRIWYRNSETKKEGFLGLDANGKVIRVAAPPPKPEPKSKLKATVKSKSKSKSIPRPTSEKRGRVSKTNKASRRV